MSPEGRPGVLGTVPVAASHVVPVQPELPHRTVREFSTGVGVDHHGPQAAGHHTAGHLGDGSGGRRRYDDGLPGGKAVTVEIGRRRSRLRGDVGDEQGGLGDAVGRLDRGGGKPVRGEGVVEGIDGRHADRFGPDDHHDVGQVEGLPLCPLGRQSALGRPLVGKVRRGGDHPALPAAVRDRLDPAVRSAYECRRRHQRRVTAVGRGKADHRQAHIVVER